MLIGVTFLQQVQCLEIHAIPFDWSSSDGNPTLTFLGPVYEAELERKKPLFQALQEAVQPLREAPSRWLPDFYNKNIGEVRHLLFRMGYSHDEEWGAIKNVAKKEGDFENERIASILSLTPERKVGLELAFRVLPTSDKSPKEATLEGYRFYKQHDGQGKAEWFTLKVRKGSREFKAVFREILVLLLIKPFSDFENIVFKQKQYSVWQNQQAGTLLFGDQSLAVDPEPILRDWLKACASIQKCSDSYEENGRYASVRNYNQASSIC